MCSVLSMMDCMFLSDLGWRSLMDCWISLRFGEVDKIKKLSKLVG